jgi:hypothetical protein
LRGVLLECDSGADGEFAVRGPLSEVFLYRFDSKTVTTRGGLAATLTLLRPGERVEISSTAIPDSPVRYAVSVMALDPMPPPQIVRPPRKPVSTSPANPLFQRGDLTFSGVVSFLANERLILRTRDGDEQTILLRSDTRYLSGGGVAKVSDLKANMRVFVRAGKDLFGHTEAYQVIWGGYLQP